MPHSIEGAIAYLVELLGSVPGTKAAPTVAPETAAGYPFVVGYERTAETQLAGAGFGYDLVTLFVEVHLSRVMLAEAIQRAALYRSALIAGVLADPTLDGTVSTVTALQRTFGGLEWGGVATIGYRFELTVKVAVEG